MDRSFCHRVSVCVFPQCSQQEFVHGLLRSGDLSAWPTASLVLTIRMTVPSCTLVVPRKSLASIRSASCVTSCDVQLLARTLSVSSEVPRTSGQSSYQELGPSIDHLSANSSGDSRNAPSLTQRGSVTEGSQSPFLPDTRE